MVFVAVQLPGANDATNEYHYDNTDISLYLPTPLKRNLSGTEAAQGGPRALLPRDRGETPAAKRDAVAGERWPSGTAPAWGGVQ